MPYLFLILFVFIPLAELYVLISVGASIGGITTILLCIVTAALGIAIVRAQGIQTLLRARIDLNQGNLPTQHMLHGLLIGLAGVLLFIPGFMTDVIGFLLLVPPLRNLLASRWLPHGKSFHHPSSASSTWIEAEIIQEKPESKKVSHK